MKKFLLLAIAITAFISCKETPASDQVAAEFETLEGEFIHLADAAVLKGDTFIYGVTLDEKMHELATIIKPLQRDEFDMVPVIIKGELHSKAAGEEGWDEIVTIKEILEVKAPTGETPLKLEAGDKLKTEGGSLKVESDK
ncbi:hypothetical protein [Dokdonia sp. Asnod2-E02]|uniref:hypothetical protein n=1 Tax=Dokdonia sp. Asnod2-E02 TaxID=3160574 RepID=UPI00386F95CB